MIRFSKFLILLCCCCFATKSYLSLCNPMDCSPPGSSVHGTFQVRTLEQTAISYSRGSSQPRDWLHVSGISCTGRWVIYHHWEAPQKRAEDLNRHLSKKETAGQKSHDKMLNTVRTGFSIGTKKAPDSTTFSHEFKKK